MEFAQRTRVVRALCSDKAFWRKHLRTRKKSSTFVRMAKRKTEGRALTPMTARQIRDVAAQLAYFAAQYSNAADEMERSSIPVLEIKGASNLDLTMGRANGAIQSLQTALLAARTAPLRGAKIQVEHSIAATKSKMEAARERERASRKNKEDPSS